MRFHALVGILAHEREFPQPLEIDLRVRVTDGEGIVDYRGLYADVSGVIGAGHIDYLEEIADRIATKALALSERVAHVGVAVRKPHVALGGPLAYAEVSLERDTR